MKCQPFSCRRDVLGVSQLEIGHVEKKRRSHYLIRGGDNEGELEASQLTKLWSGNISVVFFNNFVCTAQYTFRYNQLEPIIVVHYVSHKINFLSSPGVLNMALQTSRWH